MATTKFVIRENKSAIKKDGTTLIFLRYTHRTKVLMLSTKTCIKPEFWDSRNQRAKKAYSGYSKFNMYLDKFEQKVRDIINDARSQNIDPSTDYVKDKYFDKKNPTVQKQMSFFEFVDWFIAKASIDKKYGTIQCYKTHLKHLRDFEKYAGKKLFWHNIDLNFYSDFQQYYVEHLGNGDNAFGKQIKVLKTILNDAIERGYSVNMAFKSKKFKVTAEESEHIYLNEQELDILFKLDLTHNKKLDRVRDLFLLACWTGLRYSDINQLSKDNIIDDFIHITTHKTNQKVIIPFHPVVRAIIDKYKNKTANGLPKIISNQKMNSYLKDLGELAGFDTNIIVTKRAGALTKKLTFKKYQMITCHTARRSFATNLFKQGFPSINIMKITGHTTDRSFMKYIKTSQEEAAMMLKVHWNNTNNETMYLAKVS